MVNWLIGGDVPREAMDQEILNSWYGQSAWRWMFAATAVPSMLFFVCMLLVPESPRWLVKSGRREQARAILTRICGATQADDAMTHIEVTLTGETDRVNFKP